MIFALALTGPTASGKTAISLEVAKALGCEIISCDSMQIYKEMDVGTAKATREEQNAVPHYMIDFLSPDESYSAENYREDAMKAAREITARGKIPLFVGGTGLYIDTVIRGTSPISPPSDASLREQLFRECEGEDGRERLWQRLREVDPVSAQKTHKNNYRRVARALEIYLLTGKTKTYFDELSRAGAPDVAVGLITLDFHNRENLYAGVNARVDRMIEDGLECEVRSLYERGLLKEEYTSAQAIGYKEMIGVIKGEVSLSDAVENIKLSTRRYAKRQLTWFRHESDAERIYLDLDSGVMKDRDALIKEVTDAARVLKSHYIDEENNESNRT